MVSDQLLLQTAVHAAPAELSENVRRTFNKLSDKKLTKNDRRLKNSELNWIYWRKHWKISCKLKLKHCDTEKKQTVNQVVSSGTPRRFHNFLSLFHFDGWITGRFNRVTFLKEVAVCRMINTTMSELIRAASVSSWTKKRVVLYFLHIVTFFKPWHTLLF